MVDLLYFHLKDTVIFIGVLTLCTSSLMPRHLNIIKVLREDKGQLRESVKRLNCSSDEQGIKEHVMIKVAPSFLRATVKKE